MSTVPPIRREILVDADPQTAFEVFTTRIAQWWPLAELSVYGAGTTVAFDGGQIVERSSDGTTALWGTVTRWEPPGALAFSWSMASVGCPAARCCPLCPVMPQFIVGTFRTRTMPGARVLP